MWSTRVSTYTLSLKPALSLSLFPPLMIEGGCWWVVGFNVFSLCSCFHLLEHDFSHLFNSFCVLADWIHSEPASTISELWGASRTWPQGFGGRYSLSLGWNCKIPLKLICKKILSILDCWWQRKWYTMLQLHRQDYLSNWIYITIFLEKLHNLYLFIQISYIKLYI